MKLHLVFADDNGLYAFRGVHQSLRCLECANIRDKWDLSSTTLTVPTRMRKDISCTYDGLKIVSKKFRECVDGAGLIGLLFHPVAPGFSAITAERRVHFDVAARRPPRLGPCNSCGHFREVGGAVPTLLHGPISVDPNEFVWTDLEFGSGDEKTPLLICGDLAAQTLRNARFLGLSTSDEVRIT